MFKKKPTIDENLELNTQVNNDLIVHNMPLASKFNRSSSGRAVSSGFETGTSNKKNFKAVGLMIIVGGSIFIIGLIYLGYIFIIKPTANPSQSVNSNSIMDKVASTSLATTSNETPPSTELLMDNFSVLDLSSTTDSTIISNSESVSSSTDTNNQDFNNLPPLIDSDSDGLNDLEEVALGTSDLSSDTNNNGYSDLVEINNNYNPVSSGKLNANTKLETYHNSFFDYQILYLKDWSVASVNSGETTIFTAPDNSLIQVSVQNNSKQLSILNWYEELFPNVTPSYDKMKSLDNWDGIMGEDGSNFYLTDKQHSHVFVVSYIPAITNRVVYPNIFQLMINSLVIDIKIN